jgi:hypothetical protein
MQFETFLTTRDSDPQKETRLEFKEIADQRASFDSSDAIGPCDGSV